MADFHIKKGARAPALKCTLRAPGFDLALASGVTFRMRSGATVKTGAASVLDGAAGTVSYAWGATDTDTVGVWNGEWVVTISGVNWVFPNDGFVTVEVEENAS